MKLPSQGWKNLEIIFLGKKFLKTTKIHMNSACQEMHSSWININIDKYAEYRCNLFFFRLFPDLAGQVQHLFRNEQYPWPWKEKMFWLRLELGLVKLVHLAFQLYRKYCRPNRWFGLIKFNFVSPAVFLRFLFQSWYLSVCYWWFILH